MRFPTLNFLFNPIVGNYLADDDLNRPVLNHENLSTFDEIWKTNEGLFTAHFVVGLESFYRFPFKVSEPKVKLSSKKWQKLNHLERGDTRIPSHPEYQRRATHLGFIQLLQDRGISLDQLYHCNPSKILLYTN